MKTTMTLLNDLSFSVGLIGLAELQERTAVTRWLADESDAIKDPRETASEVAQRSDGEICAEEDVFESNDQVQDADGSTHDEDEPRWMKFLVLKKWHFTLGDVDCVPSVPHGHENAKTQSWPKLNPYTGRVFSGLHQEDASQRLSKQEMRLLWRNEDFVERCHRQVDWYSKTYQSYTFPNAKHGILRFPKW